MFMRGYLSVWSIVFFYILFDNDCPYMFVNFISGTLFEQFMVILLFDRFLSLLIFGQFMGINGLISLWYSSI